MSASYPEINSEDDLMVRKLKDVFCTIQVQVPYSKYQEFVGDIEEALTDSGLRVQISEIEQHPEVLDAFMTEVRAIIPYLGGEWENVTNNTWYHAKRIYHKEIEEANRQKHVDNQVKLLKERLDLAIEIEDSFSRQRAIAILTAAGLL